MTKHISIENHQSPNIQFARRTRIASRNLDYVNEFNYGIQARLGFRKFSFFGMYRMSDFITNRYRNAPFEFPEMPRLIIGFQIGLHG
jgi:hypothetical protein